MKKRQGFIFGSLFLLLGTLAMVIIATQKPQELRQKAAVPGGPAALILSPSSKDFPVGSPISLTLSANIADKIVDGFQIFANFSGNFPVDLSFKPASISGLMLIKNTFESTDSGKILKLAFVTEDPSQPYSNTSFITLGHISMFSKEQGTVVISYNTTLTKIAQNQTAQDIVDIPQEQTYTFSSPPTPTAPPAPTPAPIPIFGSIDWYTGHAWLKSEQFNIGFGDKYFIGKPDSNTPVGIKTGNESPLEISWTENNESMKMVVDYHFDKEQFTNIVDKITVSRGSKTYTFSANWTTKGGYAYSSPIGEVNTISSSDLKTVMSYKNLYWHPGIYHLQDIDRAQWSWKHVQKIIPTSIMPPVADWLFGPTTQISRADMALFLSRAYEFITKQTAPVVDTPFTDIGNVSEEVQTAIKKIYGIKVTAGTSATTYSPNGLVSRAQMATFLSSLYKAIKGDFAPEVPTPFTDIDNEDIKWAKIPIGRIYGLKITAGISATKFGPYLITTRQEMATFIMSFIEAVNK